MLQNTRAQKSQHRAGLLLVLLFSHQPALTRPLRRDLLVLSRLALFKRLLQGTTVSDPSGLQRGRLRLESCEL